MEKESQKHEGDQQRNELLVIPFGAPMTDMSNLVVDNANVSINVAVADLHAPIIDVSAHEAHASIVPGKDVVLCVDVSGSMGPAMASVRDTVMKVFEVLSAVDRVGIVTFSTTVATPLPLTEVSSMTRQDMQSVVNTLVATLSTNLSGGLLASFNAIAAAPQIGGDRPRMALIAVLSDGQPNVGECNEAALLTFANKEMQRLSAKFSTPPLVVIHSFGFTTGHNASILKGITATGNAGPGMYYFLRTTQDIPSAVGDCLGSVSKVMFNSIRIAAVAVNKDGEEVVGWQIVFYDGSRRVMSVGGHSDLHKDIGYMAAGEERNIVIACIPESEKSASIDNVAAALRIRLTYFDMAGNKLQTDAHAPFIASEGHHLVEGAGNQAHALTHILRLRVAQILPSIGTANSVQISGLEQLHSQIVEAIAKLQQLEVSDKYVAAALARDESILTSLENDLGDALERLNRGGRLSAQDQMRLVQFGHEHAQQRSASCNTELRPTYSTPEQEAMRVQFGADTKKAEDAMEKQAAEQKALVSVKDYGLTDEEVAKRTKVDGELHCFITLDNWRDAHLGIGLLVHPRTIRERYKRLIPQIDFAQDYVSTEAFNQGARALFAQRQQGVGGHDNTILKSSTRGRINAWLPCYFNATNWKFVRRFAPSAFSIIATQSNDKFEPIHAISVCAKLMNSAVVQFCDESLHFSEAAIQTYCDVHRLFLEMVNDFPDIRGVADAKLTNFIDKLWVRGREFTPDLGTLIQFLTVTDAVNWDTFKDAYIRESFRRSSRWIESKLGRRLSMEEPDEDLVNAWFEATRVSSSLMLFNMAFLEIIARPVGKSLDDVKAIYDASWGRLMDATVSKIRDAYHDIRAIKSLSEVMSRVGMSNNICDIAELIRWAIANEAEVRVPGEVRNAQSTSDANIKYQKIAKVRHMRGNAELKRMQAIRRVSDIKTILMGILGEQDRNFEVMDAMNSFGAFSKNAEFYCGGMIKAMRAARAKPLDTKVIKLSDVWQKDAIKQIGEGPWAAMMQTKVDGELIFCLADHTIDGRATSFGVDPEHVVKELLMMIDDKPYVFLTTGNQRVSIDQAKQALKATTARLAPSEYVPIFTGLLHTCISPVGHVSMDQTAPLIIMNEEILKLKNNKSTDFVITSAGCTGFFLKLSVDEFVRLVNPINTVKLH